MNLRAYPFLCDPAAYYTGERMLTEATVLKANQIRIIILSCVCIFI